MILHHDAYASKVTNTPLVMLHGLLGSGRNWSSMARRLAGQRPVVILDLRNHGKSPHGADMSWEALAGDVVETLNSLGHNVVDLLGHSLGGKVALRVAVSNPSLVRRLVVVDIVPKVYPPYHSRDFEAMLALPVGDLPTRKAADERLAETIPDWAHRQFLLTNLKRAESGGLAWSIPLSTLHRNLDPLRSDSMVDRPPPMQPTLFIRGGKSRFITDDDEAALRERFPNLTWQTFAESRHNPHFDCPDTLANALQVFLES